MPGKYGAIPTIYLGHRYASKKEAAYARDLELRRTAGDVKFWEPHVTFSLDVGTTHVCNYIADFRFCLRDGTVHIVDVKGGPLTAVFRLKMKLMKALYPEIDVRIVR